MNIDVEPDVLQMHAHELLEGLLQRHGPIEGFDGADRPIGQTFGFGVVIGYHVRHAGSDLRGKIRPISQSAKRPLNLPNVRGSKYNMPAV